MVDCMVEEVAWEIRKHPKLWDTCLGHADVAIMYNPDQVILTAWTIKNNNFSESRKSGILWSQMVRLYRLVFRALRCHFFHFHFLRSLR